MVVLNTIVYVEITLDCIGQRGVPVQRSRSEQKIPTCELTPRMLVDHRKITGWQCQTMTGRVKLTDRQLVPRTMTSWIIHRSALSAKTNKMAKSLVLTLELREK